MVKYGLFTCFGRKAIFSPDLICPLGLAEAAAVWAPPVLLVEFLVVPPQLESAMARMAAPAATARRRPGTECRNVIVVSLRSGVRDSVVLGASGDRDVRRGGDPGD